jgi:hypothetical protein
VPGRSKDLGSIPGEQRRESSFRLGRGAVGRIDLTHVGPIGDAQLSDPSVHKDPVGKETTSWIMLSMIADPSLNLNLDTDIERELRLHGGTGRKRALEVLRVHLVERAELG